VVIEASGHGTGLPHLHLTGSLLTKPLLELHVAGIMLTSHDMTTFEVRRRLAQLMQPSMAS
jgi:hypothetical protein